MVEMVFFGGNLYLKTESRSQDQEVQHGFNNEENCLDLFKVSTFSTTILGKKFYTLLTFSENRFVLQHFIP